MSYNLKDKIWWKISGFGYKYNYIFGHRNNMDFLYLYIYNTLNCKSQC